MFGKSKNTPRKKETVPHETSESNLQRMLRKLKKEPPEIKGETEQEKNAAVKELMETASPVYLNREEYDAAVEEDKKTRERLDKLYVKKAKGDFKVKTVSLKQQKLRKLWEVVKFFLPLAIIYVALFQLFILCPVTSGSMYPSIRTGDFALGNRIAYQRQEPKYGDIIVFRKDKSIMLKRVIGTAGDTVTLSGGRVFLNGTLLDESYLPEGTFTLPVLDGNGLSRFVVPEGCVFVLGDNRSESADSRYWTDKESGEPRPYIRVSDIYGRIFFKVGLSGGLNAKAIRPLSLKEKTALTTEIETSDEKAMYYLGEPETEAATENPDAIVIETLPVSDETSKEAVIETLPVEDDTLSIDENTGTLPLEEDSTEPEVPSEDGKTEPESTQ